MNNMRVEWLCVAGMVSLLACSNSKPASPESTTAPKAAEPAAPTQAPPTAAAAAPTPAAAPPAPPAPTADQVPRESAEVLANSAEIAAAIKREPHGTEEGSPEWWWRHLVEARLSENDEELRQMVDEPVVVRSAEGPVQQLKEKIRSFTSAKFSSKAFPKNPRWLSLWVSSDVGFGHPLEPYCTSAGTEFTCKNQFLDQFITFTFKRTSSIHYVRVTRIDEEAIIYGE